MHETEHDLEAAIFCINSAKTPNLNLLQEKHQRY